MPKRPRIADRATRTGADFRRSLRVSGARIGAPRANIDPLNAASPVMRYFVFFHCNPA